MLMDKLSVELPQDLKEAVLSLVSTTMQKTADNIKQQLRTSPYLNKTETAKYLHISPKTLLDWEKKYKDIPTIEVEGIRRYRKSDLDEFMEKHKLNK